MGKTLILRERGDRRIPLSSRMFHFKIKYLKIFSNSIAKIFLCDIIEGVKGERP